jgi:hypothetical protein
MLEGQVIVEIQRQREIKIKSIRLGKRWLKRLL